MTSDLGGSFSHYLGQVSKVKIIGQSSRSEEEYVANAVGATSSEGCLAGKCSSFQNRKTSPGRRKRTTQHYMFVTANALQTKVDAQSDKFLTAELCRQHPQR